MEYANPDAMVFRDGFKLLKTLAGLPTFSVDPEDSDILFVLSNWKTDRPEVIIYTKTLTMPAVILSDHYVNHVSAKSLASFRSIFKDWVNRMVQVSIDNDAKLLKSLERKPPPGFCQNVEKKEQCDAPPGWSIPGKPSQSFGSIAEDRRNWEQAQARKNNDL